MPQRDGEAFEPMWNFYPEEPQRFWSSSANFYHDSAVLNFWLNLIRTCPNVMRLGQVYFDFD